MVCTLCASTRNLGRKLSKFSAVPLQRCFSAYCYQFGNSVGLVRRSNTPLLRCSRSCLLSVLQSQPYAPSCPGLQHRIPPQMVLQLMDRCLLSEVFLASGPAPVDPVQRLGLITRFGDWSSPSRGCPAILRIISLWSTYFIGQSSPQSLGCLDGLYPGAGGSCVGGEVVRRCNARTVVAAFGVRVLLCGRLSVRRGRQDHEQMSQPSRSTCLSVLHVSGPQLQNTSSASSHIEGRHGETAAGAT